MRGSFQMGITIRKKEKTHPFRKRLIPLASSIYFKRVSPFDLIYLLLRSPRKIFHLLELNPAISRRTRRAGAGSGIFLVVSVSQSWLLYISPVPSFFDLSYAPYSDINGDRDIGVYYRKVRSQAFYTMSGRDQHSYLRTITKGSKSESPATCPFSFPWMMESLL